MDWSGLQSNRSLVQPVALWSDQATGTSCPLRPVTVLVASFLGQPGPVAVHGPSCRGPKTATGPDFQTLSLTPFASSTPKRPTPKKTQRKTPRTGKIPVHALDSDPEAEEEVEDVKLWKMINGYPEFPPGAELQPIMDSSVKGKKEVCHVSPIKCVACLM